MTETNSTAVENATHTPGPWELVRDPRRGVAIQARADLPSRCHIAYVQFAGTDLEDGLANARLIAAAPELLQELRNAVIWIEEFVAPAALNQQAVERVLNQFRAAIAKAEGAV